MTEQKPIIEQLLTKRDAAELLCITERTLDNYRSEGRILAVKLGKGAVRFDPVDLRNFIDRSKCGPDPSQAEDGGGR